MSRTDLAFGLITQTPIGWLLALGALLLVATIVIELEF
jgi:hypothetical protein